MMADSIQGKWFATQKAIDKLTDCFCEVHQTPGKDLSQEQHNYLRELRSQCVTVTYERYDLLRQARKLNVPVTDL